MIAENRAKKYSMTQAHYYGSLIFAIPPGRKFSSFEKLFFPFKVIIWSCIGAIFLFAAIIIVALKLSSRKKRDFFIGKSNDMPFFNMISHCFGGNTASIGIPKRNFARTLLLIWLLSTLILRNAYQGKLFDNLRSQQRNAPHFLIDDLFQSHLKLYLYESFFQDTADNVPNQYDGR